LIFAIYPNEVYIGLVTNSVLNYIAEVSTAYLDFNKIRRVVIVILYNNHI